MARLVLWLRRAAVVTAAWTLCIDVSCTLDPKREDDDDQPIPGPSRRLDVACRFGACVTEGSAVLGAGPTSESVALRIGPGAGSVHCACASPGAIPPGYAWHAAPLVPGAGSFMASSWICTLSSGVKGPGTPSQVMS